MGFLRIFDDSRSYTYSIIIGTWAIVAIYAILHDQYIVRITPEHFTLYHRPLWGLDNPRLLAAGHAFLASIAPGVILRMACVVIGRVGYWPRISRRFIFRGILVVILLTEVTAATSGWWAYSAGRGLYPSSWYPKFVVPMIVTDTIQITCYLFGAVFSACLLLLLVTVRRSRAKAIAKQHLS